MLTARRAASKAIAESRLECYEYFERNKEFFESNKSAVWSPDDCIKWADESRVKAVREARSSTALVALVPVPLAGFLPISLYFLWAGSSGDLPWTPQ
jgi:hypothetical protein